jgi:CspA family cold shock protein
MPGGTIKNLRLDKGYGFIEPSGGGPDCFFHLSQLQHPLTFDETLIERHVEFDLDPGAAKPRAVNVRPAR